MGKINVAKNTRIAMGHVKAHKKSILVVAGTTLLNLGLILGAAYATLAVSNKLLEPLESLSKDKDGFGQ